MNAVHVDDNRRWLLDSARGNVTTEGALDTVRFMRLRADLAEKDPELAEALAEGDRRHPDDRRRWHEGPAPWERDIDADPATNEAFDELAAERGRKVAAALAGEANGVMTYCAHCGESMPLAYFAEHELTCRGDSGGPGAMALADGHRPTDTGNADRLAANADGRIRYVHAWCKWIVYSDGVWQVDTADARITEEAKSVAREMFRTAVRLAPYDREPMLKWARRSETAAAIAAMVRLARGIPGVLVDHQQLDQQPWLLNVANGVVDLRTGELGPHSPEHLLTIQTPVRFDPDAQAPVWEACLERWQPDPDMRGFLQRVVGSAATGHPVEHLFVNTGAGGNGKSKFYGAVMRVLGPYAIVPDKSLFVLTRHEPHPTVRAELFGARMLLAPETEAGDRLAEAQIKELTGGDRMTGRRMREDPWEFWPTWSAFLHTNHRPAVRGTDEGVWRRIRLIPWDVTIPAAERDAALADKLAAEASGILNWIVAGALEWAARGLDEPAQVQEATDSYRSDSDMTARFIREADLELDLAGEIPSADLTLAHEKWCDDSGLRHNEQWQLTSDGLKKLGASPARTRAKGRFWKGIRAGTDVRGDAG